MSVHNQYTPVNGTYMCTVGASAKPVRLQLKQDLTDSVTSLDLPFSEMIDVLAACRKRRKRNSAFNCSCAKRKAT